MKVLSAFILWVCFIYICLPVCLSSDGAPVTSILKEAQEKFKKESYQESLSLFDNAKKIDPTQIDAWYGVAESNYHLEKYKECDEICDQTLRDKPFEDTGDLDRFAELAAECTVAYKEQTGKDLVNVLKPGEVSDAYQQAREYYYLAITLNNSSTSAWNSLGMLESRLFNYTGSISCFNEALKINSSLAEVWSNKGASLASLGRFNESLECLDGATELDPDLAEAWYNKAKTLGKLKDEALAKGKTLNPDLVTPMQFSWFWNEI